MSRRVLVVTHSGREEAVAATAEAVKALEGAGFKPVLATDDSRVENVGELELAIVLGGTARSCEPPS